MNDLDNATTADLIAEWEQLNSCESTYHVDRCKECGHEQRSMNYWPYCESCNSIKFDRWILSDQGKQRKFAIATELDRRCERHGIYHDPKNDRFYFYETYGTIDKERFRPNEKRTVIGNASLSGKELHALLGWLLMKEGGNNA